VIKETSTEEDMAQIWAVVPLGGKKIVSEQLMSILSLYTKIYINVARKASSTKVPVSQTIERQVL
jgi:hypothetical protein